MNGATQRVREYWDSHHLGTQFLGKDLQMPVGSPEYFMKLDEAMERWEYKNRLIDWIASHSGTGTLLEVGCGLGSDLVKFAKRGFAVTGIDMAPTVISNARKHLEVYHLPGTVLQGDAENLSFYGNTFHIVYSCGVLQHTPDIRRAVGEIYRVLRTGGIAIIILYYRYSWFNFVRSLARVNVEFEDEDAPIINTYTKSALHRIFSGFHKHEIYLEYCYPTPTLRKGLLAAAYNRAFIPSLSYIPYRLMKHFGWHAIVKAEK